MVFFDGQETSVIRVGNSLNFIVKLKRPFGMVELEFTGQIKNNSIIGNLVFRGFPDGTYRSVPFTGMKEKKAWAG